MSSEATVYVVDDDSATRDSLRWLLRSVGLRVEAYDSAEAFLERYGPTCRGCVVLDVRMPGLSGLELQDRLNRDGACLPVILVTGHGDVPTAVRALKGGAYDFVEKPIQEQEMLDRIQRAIALDAERWHDRERRRELELRAQGLTAREREVFGLVVQGKPNKVIASLLGLSQKTVEVHRAHVMRKMEADTFADLVRMAITLGLVEGVVSGNSSANGNGRVG